MEITTLVLGTLLLLLAAAMAYKARLELKDLKVYNRRIQSAYDDQTRRIHALESEVLDLRTKLELASKFAEVKFNSVEGAQ